MRIISGLLKRYRFNPPKGFPSRPTTDFAKEGLFNLIVNEFDLENLNILDLFAGTGNISFEFASRQAGKIIAVDSDFRSIKFIQQFAKNHKLDEYLTALKSDAFRYIENSRLENDIIFADPPFNFEQYEELIEAILASKILSEDGLFILEHDPHHDFSNHPKFRSSRKYGHIVFSFFEHNP
ncbi:MAG: RsmD family RNA methyltransferase [Brumimicrobium sp.]|nr:RsmD family RNA methyltransferase [Brumimicrobium sp.]MCO5268639.1 RsmD family RNA methyltransferase [Brumimicrobium sp.]